MKKIMILSVMILLILTGCNTQVPQSASVEQEEPKPISTVSAKNCYLCGDGAKDNPYWGQNNVGIISLNTFEFMPVEINRYDEDGTWNMDEAGYMSSHGFQDDNNGFFAHVFEFPDSGRASGSVTLNEDRVLDTEKAAAFLCQDCLDTVLSDHYHPSTGVGVINFETRELHPLEEHMGGVSLGNYYIDLDWKEPDETPDDRDIDIQIFFSIRYPGEGSEG